MFQLNTALIFVDNNNFTVTDFGGLLLTGLIRHINTANAPGFFGAATYAAAAAAASALTPAQVAAAATVTANAAN